MVVMQVVSCSQFEAHAGRGARRAPYDFIFTGKGVPCGASQSSGAILLFGCTAPGTFTVSGLGEWGRQQHPSAARHATDLASCAMSCPSRAEDGLSLRRMAERLPPLENDPEASAPLVARKGVDYARRAANKRALWGDYGDEDEQQEQWEG